MKSFKLLASSALLLGSIALTAPGFAGDWGDKGGPKQEGDWRHGQSGKRIEKMLDLTDTQKETLKTQRVTNKSERQALREKITAAHEALSTAVEAGANDAELAALAENLGKLHAQQALAAAQAHKAFVAVLTDEQRKKLAELKAKRKEHRKARDNRQHSSSSVSGS